MQAQHRNKKSHDDYRDNAEFTLDTTVAFSRSGSVDLQSFSGDITVIAWDRDEVKIHAKSRNEIHFDASPSRVSLAENPGDHDDEDPWTWAETTASRSACRSPRGSSMRSISGDLKVRQCLGCRGAYGER